MLYGNGGEVKLTLILHKGTLTDVAPWYIQSCKEYVAIIRKGKPQKVRSSFISFCQSVMSLVYQEPHDIEADCLKSVIRAD